MGDTVWCMNGGWLLIVICLCWISVTLIIGWTTFVISPPFNQVGTKHSSWWSWDQVGCPVTSMFQDVSIAAYAQWKLKHMFDTSEQKSVEFNGNHIPLAMVFVTAFYVPSFLTHGDSRILFRQAIYPNGTSEPPLNASHVVGQMLWYAAMPLGKS